MPRRAKRPTDLESVADLASIVLRNESHPRRIVVPRYWPFKTLYTKGEVEAICALAKDYPKTVKVNFREQDGRLSRPTRLATEVAVASLVEELAWMYTVLRKFDSGELTPSYERKALTSIQRSAASIQEVMLTGPVPLSFRLLPLHDAVDAIVDEKEMWELVEQTFPDVANLASKQDSRMFVVHRLAFAAQLLNRLAGIALKSPRALVGRGARRHFGDKPFWIWLLSFFGHDDSEAMCEELNSRLTSSIEVETMADRPIRVVPINDPIDQTSYQLKSTFDRTVEYVDFRRSSGRRMHNTADYDLRDDQLIELALHLSQYKAQDRELWMNTGRWPTPR